VRHIDGWRLVALEDGSSSSSDPEDQVVTELLNFPKFVGGQSQVVFAHATKHQQVQLEPRKAVAVK
jgi:hypothetical protein